MTIGERIKSLFGPRTKTNRTDLTPLSMGSASAGVWIDEESALTIGAVFSAVRILSEDIASLPLHLYDQAGGGRRKATNRPEYRLLHSKPNSYQTAYDFREALIARALLRGNGFAEIERNALGAPIALHIIDGDVQIRSTQDGPVYQIGGQVLQSGSVLHVKAFSTDGISGRSVIRLAREAIGLASATEQYGAAFFGNSATPGGVLETDKSFKDPEAIRRLRESWEGRHRGPQNAGGVAILEDGLKFHQIGIPPEDAQFLETRKFQVSDIARWFRIPAHMLGDLSDATFSNIEHQALEYVKHTLRPWLVRLEQAFTSQLIPDQLQGDLYFEHNVEGLLRADIESRYNAYAVGRQWGWLSANDIRQKENMEPIDGGYGYLVPLNMQELGDVETVDDRAKRAEIAGVLVRAGYDPQEAARIAGIDPIEHTGLYPVTVQREAREDVGGGE